MSRASEPVGTVEDVARGGMLAHAHDAALAELALDLGDGGFKGFVPIHGGALLSLGCCGKRRKGSVDGPGPLQEASIQDDRGQSKCSDGDVLQRKWVTGATEAGDRQ